MTKLKAPKIITELPGPKSENLLGLRDKNVPSGVSGHVPVFIERGEGALFEDVDGNVFLDWVGGIGVLNIGYSHPEVIKAVKEQADRYFHTSINIVSYQEYVKLAEKLNDIVPGDFPKKTMFVNSGAEAVENAIKIARKYTKRTEIITFSGAFHGRTLLTMTLTSKVKPYKFEFGPFAPGIHRTEFPHSYRRPDNITSDESTEHYIKKLENFMKEYVVPEDVAAIILEPVQGEGGFNAFPIDYVKELRALCNKHGILLIADEVQSGYCRTGKMFATEYWAERGIYADLVTSAKSIAAGLPLSSVTGRQEVMEAPHIGGIGGTYCGNPVAAAAALKVIEVMERDNYAQKANDIAKIAMKRFEEMKDKYEIIGDVRGLGAMMAIELVESRDSKEPAKEKTQQIIKECWKNGLIVTSASVHGNVIRFLMPLVITEEQLQIGLNILDEAFAKVLKK